MKSAGINFGLPQSEYVAEVNDQGEAISFRNQDTDTEYIGGGSGLPDISAGDAGKVLTVSDELAAEWVSNVIICTPVQDGEVCFIGLTNRQVREALTAGKKIIVVFPDDFYVNPGCIVEIIGSYVTPGDTPTYGIVAMDIQGIVLPSYQSTIDQGAGFYYD